MVSNKEVFFNCFSLVFHPIERASSLCFTELLGSTRQLMIFFISVWKRNQTRGSPSHDDMHQILFFNVSLQEVILRKFRNLSIRIYQKGTFRARHVVMVEGINNTRAFLNRRNKNLLNIQPKKRIVIETTHMEPWAIETRKKQQKQLSVPFGYTRPLLLIIHKNQDYVHNKKEIF